MCTHNGKQGKPRVNKEINIGVLTTLLTTASSLLTGWMTNKKEKQEQVHAKEMEKIKNTNDWEITQAKGSVNSLKDEYWTIIFSIPLILCFIPNTLMQDLRLLLVHLIGIKHVY